MEDRGLHAVWKTYNPTDPNITLLILNITLLICNITQLIRRHLKVGEVSLTKLRPGWRQVVSSALGNNAVQKNGMELSVSIIAQNLTEWTVNKSAAD
jgi:hypothetical protein